MSHTSYFLAFALFSAQLSASHRITTDMVNPIQRSPVELSIEAQKRIVTAQVTLKNLVKPDYFYADKPEKVILYTNIVKQLEKDFALVTDLESQCEISYLLGQAYFKGYKTDKQIQIQAVNRIKAFSYLKFLVEQTDANVIRQSCAYGLLSNIYATGVKGWCGWKIPVDTKMAKKYANYAQLLSEK